MAFSQTFGVNNGYLCRLLFLELFFFFFFFFLGGDRLREGDLAEERKRFGFFFTHSLHGFRHMLR